MKIVKRTIKKEFKQINREYIIASKELRKALELEGELLHIDLYSGRSPQDQENGKSAELDTWIFTTKEVIE